jgi:acetoin utilization deacetylase AcuC-like enzyme
MTHSLIVALGFLPEMIIESPGTPSEEDLKLFHSEEYIGCLRRLSEMDDEEKYDEDAEIYGLSELSCGGVSKMESKLPAVWPLPINS